MLFITLLLCVYSVVVLSAITPELVVPQVISIVIGLMLYFIVRRIDSRAFIHLWGFWYALSLILLLITLFGPEVRGSNRWIEFAGQRIQPSEIVKPILITSFAAIIAQFTKYSIRQYILLLLLFLVPFFLVFEQPDLGNAIVYTAILAILVLVSRFGIKYVVIPGFLLFSAIPIVWNFLEVYQKNRIVTFVNPEYDVQGVGYNARQALIAVGSGGWWGKGLGQGTQSRLQFLPEFHTDFIFASTVEQLGFIGGILLLFLYLVLFIQLIRASRGQDDYRRLVIYGMLTQLFVQVFINVGMNLGIVPITGITLPLFSYGGSSIMATFLGLGIISSFKQHGKQPISIG